MMNVVIEIAEVACTSDLAAEDLRRVIATELRQELASRLPASEPVPHTPSPHFGILHRSPAQQITAAISGRVREELGVGRRNNPVSLMNLG